MSQNCKYPAYGWMDEWMDGWMDIYIHMYVFVVAWFTLSEA